MLPIITFLLRNLDGEDLPARCDTMRSSSTMSAVPSIPSKGESASTRRILESSSCLRPILTGSSRIEVVILPGWSAASSTSLPSSVIASRLTLLRASRLGRSGSVTLRSVMRL